MASSVKWSERPLTSKAGVLYHFFGYLYKPIFQKKSKIKNLSIFHHYFPEIKRCTHLPRNGRCRFTKPLGQLQNLPTILFFNLRIHGKNVSFMKNHSAGSMVLRFPNSGISFFSLHSSFVIHHPAALAAPLLSWRQSRLHSSLVIRHSSLPLSAACFVSQLSGKATPAAYRFRSIAT